MRTCDYCGTEYEPKRKTSKFCTAKCRYHAHVVKDRPIKLPYDLRWSILRRDKFTCRYCGARPPKGELRVDHVVSIADGGARTDRNNLVTACMECNSGKSRESLDPAEVPAHG